MDLLKESTHYGEKERAKRVPLTNSPRGLNFTSQSTIVRYGKVRAYTLAPNPLPPSITKAFKLHHMVKIMKT